jgi:hypothetical protein
MAFMAAAVNGGVGGGNPLTAADPQTGSQVTAARLQWLQRQCTQLLLTPLFPIDYFIHTSE